MEKTATAKDSERKIYYLKNYMKNYYNHTSIFFFTSKTLITYNFSIDLYIENYPLIAKTE